MRYETKIQRYLVSVVLILVLSSCGTYTSATTFESALDQYFVKSGKSIASTTDGMQVVRTKDFGAGVIAIYYDPRPQYKTYFFQVVWKSADGWFTNETGDGGGSFYGSPPPTSQRIHVADGRFGRDTRSAVVYGTILDSRVAFVETTFPSGRIAKDTVEHGVFILVMDNEMLTCDIRLYDKEHLLLQRTDMTGNPVDESYRCGN